MRSTGFEILGVAGLLAACSACPPPAACPPARVVPLAPPAAARPAHVSETSFETRVSGAKLVYVFRASRLTNLLYEIDCLAGLVHCSKPAFEGVWQSELGGLSAEDRRALDEWKALRYRYGGRIQKRVETPEEDPGLPLPYHARQFETRVRLAEYSADSPKRMGENLGLFLDASDVALAERVVARFSDRFEPHWQKVAGFVERATREFPKTLKAKKLDLLVEQVARFYGADLPPGTEITFDLVARPIHDSASNAEPIANHALVEILPDEVPEDRLDVVLHELFHTFYASAKHRDLLALLRRFADSPDPLAYPAHGVLDESLATTLGNGLVLERIDPKRLEKRLARKRGMYDDDFIDPVSRELLGPLREWVAAGRGIADPAFFDLYMSAVKRAFPQGMPPRAYLRPWIAAYDPDLEGSWDALDRIARAGQSVSNSSLTARDSHTLFAERPRWSRVLMLKSSALSELDAWSEELTRPELARIRARNAKGGSFVWAVTKKDRAELFVFVAENQAAMLALVERFAGFQKLAPGELRL